MSDIQENVGKAVGGTAGTAAGVGTSIAAISSSGSVVGLSGAGISTGLAAVGGGTMVGGLIVTTGGVAALAVGGVLLGGYVAKKIKERKSRNSGPILPETYEYLAKVYSERAQNAREMGCEGNEARYTAWATDYAEKAQNRREELERRNDYYEGFFGDMRSK